MAKVGEGDTRWIVQDRVDGRNVNNWHWSEKDVSGWAHARLRALLSGLRVRSPEGSSPSADISIVEVDSVEGDATLYNRKGRLRTLHDLKVSAKWEATVDAAPTKVKGTLKFELYDDAPDIAYFSDDTTRAAIACKDTWKSFGASVIHPQCELFVRELQAGADAVDLDVPATAERPVKTTSSSSKSIAAASAVTQDTKMPARKDTRTPEASAASSKHTLRITEEFRCSPMDLYKAFVDAERVSGYTMRPAHISTEVGGKFSIRDGVVSGTQVKLVPGKQIVQKWRHSSYPEGLTTDLSLTIRDREGSVVLELVHKGIPESHMTETEREWRLEILQRIKVVLGYGSARFF